jgi:hypothetical protein
MSDYICRILSHAGHVQRHEDKYVSGVPDISYCLSKNKHGWLELKYIDVNKIKPKQIINIPHFTSEQKNWLESRGEIGCKCYLLLFVDDVFVTIPWFNLTFINKTKWEHIWKISKYTWNVTKNPYEVIDIFKKL